MFPWPVLELIQGGFIVWSAGDAIGYIKLDNNKRRNSLLLGINSFERSTDMDTFVCPVTTITDVFNLSHFAFLKAEKYSLCCLVS